MIYKVSGSSVDELNVENPEAGKHYQSGNQIFRFNQELNDNLEVVNEYFVYCGNLLHPYVKALKEDQIIKL